MKRYLECVIKTAQLGHCCSFEKYSKNFKRFIWIIFVMLQTKSGKIFSESVSPSFGSKSPNAQIDDYRIPYNPSVHVLHKRIVARFTLIFDVHVDKFILSSWNSLWHCFLGAAHEDRIINESWENKHSKLFSMAI